MNYKNFEKQLLKIYQIPLNKYLNKLTNTKDYVCQNKSPETIKLINQKLRFMIKN